MAESAMYTAFEGQTGPFAAFLPAMSESLYPIAAHGSPQGMVPAVPGQSYIDLDSGNLWIKVSGTQTLGWLLIGPSGGVPANPGTGGGGTSMQVFQAASDPNGNITATGPGLAIGDGTQLGKLWAKSTAGTSNMDWFLLIG